MFYAFISFKFMFSEKNFNVRSKKLVDKLITKSSR